MYVCLRVRALSMLKGHITAWSAPSAIGTAGMGFGGQLGAEVTDFLLILNSRAVSTVAATAFTY